MQKSWETVANNLASHMSLKSLHRGLASELAYLERDGEPLNAAEIAATKQTIELLTVWLGNWIEERKKN